MVEWSCMTAQSRVCLAVHAIQPRLVWSPSIHYFHLLVQHGAQFPECCSRNQILKRQISTELSIITLLLHLISFLQYLHIYPSHITLPYQSACASRSGTIWLPIRWCHILCTTCNAILIIRMLMNAKSLPPFPGANNPSHGVYWEWKPSSFKIHFRLWNINIGFDGLSLGSDDVTIPDSPKELIEAHYIFLKWPSCVLEWAYEFSYSFGVNESQLFWCFFFGIWQPKTIKVEAMFCNFIFFCCFTLLVCLKCLIAFWTSWKHNQARLPSLFSVVIH